MFGYQTTGVYDKPHKNTIIDLIEGRTIPRTEEWKRQVGDRTQHGSMLKEELEEGRGSRGKQSYGRSSLTASNGDMIYNTTVNKIQAYQNGAWINIEDGSNA